MKISIKKTIETEDYIEVETPSFYFNNSISTYYCLTEKCVIMVSTDQITYVSKESISGTWYESEIQKAISKEKITETVFLEKLFETQEKINNACGLSPVPTIFTQNKFGMFQKALAAIIFFICFSFSSFAQDSIIKCHKVKIAETVGVNRKTGKIVSAYPKWVVVKSGFITKESNGLFLINGKEYKPGDHKPLKFR